MSWPEVLLLALALSADAFSMAVAVGLRCSSPRQIFRLSWHFGLFQALMPFLGAAAGAWIIVRIGDFDHWIAFAILEAIGIRMLWEHRAGTATRRTRADPTRGWSLVALSLATSIDAFGAGIGLAVTRSELVRSCLTIGAITGALTLLGMGLGARAARFGERWAPVVGALVLMGLGAKILFE